MKRTAWLYNASERALYRWGRLPKRRRRRTPIELGTGAIRNAGGSDAPGIRCTADAAAGPRARRAPSGYAPPRPGPARAAARILPSSGPRPSLYTLATPHLATRSRTPRTPGPPLSTSRSSSSAHITKPSLAPDHCLIACISQSLSFMAACDPGAESDAAKSAARGAPS